MRAAPDGREAPCGRREGAPHPPAGPGRAPPPPAKTPAPTPPSAARAARRGRPATPPPEPPPPAAGGLDARLEALRARRQLAGHLPGADERVERAVRECRALARALRGAAAAGR